MMDQSKINEFCNSVDQSLKAGSFIKLSLGNYQGNEADLKKIQARKIMIKREEKLSFTYRYKTRDIVKNHSHDEAVAKVGEFLTTGFQNGSLFTSEFDLVYEAGKDDLKRKKPESVEAPSLEHDKKKTRFVKKEKTWLQDLKITDDKGNVFKNAQDKYRQINRYIEILAPLVERISAEQLKVVDMGSGKGYLTFALYDYLTDVLGKTAQVTGVEYRADMVELCNKVAVGSDLSGLKFVQDSIENYFDEDFNILIALHACDTATDDAIYKGIQAKAELIVVAPCCHKQIRREIEKNKANNDLNFILKHGILMERQAEMVTDSLRSLILEYAGYTTRVFEFVSDAHTAKNVMIVAEKKNKTTDPGVLDKIKAAKKYFGIERHHLEELLQL